MAAWLADCQLLSWLVGWVVGSSALVGWDWPAVAGWLAGWLAVEKLGQNSPGVHSFRIVRRGSEVCEDWRRCGHAWQRVRPLSEQLFDSSRLLFQLAADCPSLARLCGFAAKACPDCHTHENEHGKRNQFVDGFPKSVQ